jgi:hypothetical protein
MVNNKRLSNWTGVFISNDRLSLKQKNVAKGVEVLAGGKDA